jgi:hypothetical protein
MDRGAFAPGHPHSVCLQRAEPGVTRADFGMAGPECDNDMNHHHARVSCHGDQIRHARDRIGGLRSRHEFGEGDLIIHHQQRGAPGIDVRKLRHAFLLAKRCDVDNDTSRSFMGICIVLLKFGLLS